MVRTLLDTNVCIAYLKGGEAAVQNALLARAPSEVFLCSVVKAELLHGARRSVHVARNLERLAAFFGAMTSLPFDDDAAEQYGIIRAQLEAAGTPLGANDLLIASIAQSHDATVLTRNLNEFRRVPGLRVETC